MRERMRPHGFDAFSLVAGLLFLALGVIVAVDASAGRDVDPRWMLAVLLVGLGLAGVLGSLDRPRRDRDPGEDASDDPLDSPTPRSPQEWT